MSEVAYMMGYLSTMVIVFASRGLMYHKAGPKWWSAFIPVYNWAVLLDLDDDPRWWSWLIFIPVVNIWMMYRSYSNLAERYNHGIGIVVLLIFPYTSVLAWLYLGYVATPVQGEYDELE